MSWNPSFQSVTEGRPLYRYELPEDKLQRLLKLAAEARTETRMEIWVQKVWDLLDYLAQEGIA